ncbi:MAG: hypothetical protein HUU15_17925, partial [Candidatus Brocadiae bacterium]|nr:hypothetical protein [Candidatus Brocadiia bacterium]
MSGHDCDGMLARRDDGDRSPEVLRHVSECPECRRMLEVDAAVREWAPAAAADPAAFVRRLPLSPPVLPIRRTAWLPWAVAAA